MSITKKLVAAFGVLFLLFAGFGLFTLHSSSEMNDQSVNVKDWTASRMVVSDIVDGVEGAQRSALLRILSSGASDGGRWRDEERSFVQKTDDAFARYRQILDESDYDTVEEQQADLALLESEVKLWQDYKEQLGKADALLASGNRAGAVALLNGAAMDSFQKINEAMEKDVAACNEGIETATNASEETYQRITVWTGVAAAIVLAVLLLVLYELAQNIRRSVQQIIAATNRAAQGDLSGSISLASSDEFGYIAGQFDAVIEHVRKALGKVQDAAEEVASSADNLTESAHQSAEAVQSVAQSITVVSENATGQMDLLGEIKGSVHALEDSLNRAVDAMKAGLESVQETARHATKGNTLAQDTVRQMNEIADTVANSARIVEELGENSKEIGSIVEVISSIAEQTNLLALNAAIEAARAGEQGRGFAVVADEVRKLAEGSQTAAQQISDRIRGIQETTQRAVEAMETGKQRVEQGRGNVESTGKSFHDIVEQIETARENSQVVMETVSNLHAPISEIVNMAEQASSKAVNVAEEAQSVSAASQEQAAGMEEIAASSRSLADLSQTMKDAVNEFRLGRKG